MTEFQRGFRAGLAQAILTLRTIEEQPNKAAILALVQLMPREAGGSSTVDMLGTAPTVEPPAIDADNES